MSERHAFIAALAVSILAAIAASAALAQTTTPRVPDTARGLTPLPVEQSGGALYLSAVFGADPQPVRAGLVWRVLNERAEPDGSHAIIAESREAAPGMALPDGAYIVHAAYGLAAVTKRVVVAGKPVSERLVLNAGGLRIVGALGDANIAPSKLSISIFVPERGNSEAKLVLQGAKPDEIFGLPEGTYHIVSTYLEPAKPGSPAPPGLTGLPTNSIVTADLRVQAGKLTETTLRHRAATLTIKLVNAPGGEALANTVFNILTPGGDLIRELVGAFPSLVLAEGEYIAVARHDEKTYQATFKVQSALDRDIEVLAK